MLTTNVGRTTTYFVGNHYEVSNGVVTKYYYAGATRIAVRENGVLSYIIGDHLGSTSIVTDASGNLIAQQKYKAWGEVRYESGTNPSEYSYTGQYSYTDDFGLMFYNACWYDSSLSRFAQADTIVPSGSQGLDRYAYVNNSPVMYTDPSGHDAWWCEGNDSCLYNWLDDNTKGDNEELLFEKYNVTVDENMPSEAKRTIMQGIYIAGTRFSETIGGTAAEAFRAVYGLNDGDSFRFEFVQSRYVFRLECWQMGQQSFG